MRRLRRPALGLLGQVVAILLITLLIELGASTLLYERASRFAVRDDEANRLAEHLVISRRLIGERSPAQRGTMAAELTTDRYALLWSPTPHPTPRIAPALDEMQRQVIEWEPSLRDAQLTLQLLSPGRRSVVTGGMRLVDGSWVYFRTREPLAGISFTAERIALALFPAIALMVLAGVALRRSFRPLRVLAAAADRVGHGTVEPVAVDGPGEVRRVISAFNDMQERIRALIAGRTQALAAVGHDLRTPLARLHLRTDSLPHDDTRAAILRDVAEMEAMITSLLAFLGGADPEAPSMVDLAVLCATVIDDAADRGADARYDGPDHLELRVRRLSIKRALTNLVENALHYGDTVTLTLAHEPRPAVTGGGNGEGGENGVAIRVVDDGPGIPADQLQAVLEPFVRLDPARGRDTVGFGLGLSIVAKAVADEGGTLTLSNRGGDRDHTGLEACIWLPDTQ